MQLRDRRDEIRAAGAEIVVIGNGAAHFARAFRGDYELDFPLLVDPDRVAYRAAGLRRGLAGTLSPRVALHAARALAKGFFQTSVQGDALQLGGVFVIRRGGGVAYRHASQVAGDHAPLDDVLRALRR